MPGSPDIYLETVDWRVGDVKHTVLKLVSYFAKSLPELGTRPWLNFALGEVLAVVREEKTEGALHAEGFDLIFRWPRSVKPMLVAGGLVFSSLEPYFVLDDDSFLKLMPRYRAKLYAVSGAIAREMSDVYKMRVTHEPLTLIIPKGEYGIVKLHKTAF